MSAGCAREPGSSRGLRTQEQQSVDRNECPPLITHSFACLSAGITSGSKLPVGKLRETRTAADSLRLQDSWAWSATRLAQDPHPGEVR